MARIVVHTWAYRGDVFPFVPIANELVRRGHRVTFVVPRGFHEILAGQSFELIHAGVDISPRELDEIGDDVHRWGMRFGGGYLMRIWFGRFVVPYLDAIHDAVDDALDGADLLVSHPAAALVGRIAAERRGIPWATATPLPMIIPSAERVPPGWPLPAFQGRTGMRLNQLAWRMSTSRLARWLMWEAAFDALRQRHGLAPLPGTVVSGQLSPHLVLALVSPRYFPVPGDWPAHFHAVGFSHWDTPSADGLSDGVRAFLDHGEPPVLVTLGTSGASAARDVFPNVARALDRLGLRGLYLVSNETNAATLDGRPGVWPYVPLSQVLSRCRAAVHSGAQGTNAAVLAAGLPAVIVPQMFDQRYHALRVAQLGAGQAVLHRRSSEPALRRAIDTVVTDPAYARRALDLAQAMQDEDAVGSTCDHLEALV